MLLCANESVRGVKKIRLDVNAITIVTSVRAVLQVFIAISNHSNIKTVLRIDRFMKFSSMLEVSYQPDFRLYLWRRKIRSNVASLPSMEEGSDLFLLFD